MTMKERLIYLSLAFGDIRFVPLNVIGYAIAGAIKARHIDCVGDAVIAAVQDAVNVRAEMLSILPDDGTYYAIMDYTEQRLDVLEIE